MYANVFRIINIANRSFTGISAKERKKNKNDQAKPIPVSRGPFLTLYYRIRRLCHSITGTANKFIDCHYTKDNKKDNMGRPDCNIIFQGVYPQGIRYCSREDKKMAAAARPTLILS